MKIGDKEVTFRDHLPAAEWWELFPIIASVKPEDKLMDKFDWPTAVKIARASVESWDFDGDPGDVPAYEALGITAMSRIVQGAYANAVAIINAETDAAGE